MAVNPRLLFHHGDHGKIDLIDGQSVQIRIQQDIQLQQRLVIQLLLHRQNVVLQDIALQNDHRQKLVGIHTGELNKFQFAAF